MRTLSSSPLQADLVFSFACQMLNPEFNVNDSREVKAAAKVFTEEKAAVLANKEVVVWEAPPG